MKIKSSCAFGSVWKKMRRWLNRGLFSKGRFKIYKLHTRSLGLLLFSDFWTEVFLFQTWSTGMISMISMISTQNDTILIWPEPEISVKYTSSDQSGSAPVWMVWKEDGLSAADRITLHVSWFQSIKATQTTVYHKQGWAIWPKKKMFLINHVQSNGSTNDKYYTELGLGHMAKK